VQVKLDLSKVTDVYIRAIFRQVSDVLTRLDSSSWVKEQITVGSSATVELRHNPLSGSVTVFNGVTPLHEGNDYSVAGNRLKLALVAPGSVIYVQYQRYN
jgi:hypothetical protein